MPRAGLIVLALLTATPAAAHWEYTRWGMTEDAVIAASRGAARTLPTAQRRRQGDLDYRAAARIEAEGARFRVVFGFGRAGLRCVSIRAEDPRQAPALRRWITRGFGPPQQVGGDAEQSVLAWSRPDSIEILVQPDAAIALHCAQ
ncbi:MAG: hypothetical protein V4653_04330 [Pseudomonadota bacterium]